MKRRCFASLCGLFLLFFSVFANHAAGRSPFYYALYGDYESLEKALKAGADPNETNRFGQTPLNHAIHNNHPKIVQLLLAHGADPNHHRNDGLSVLREAATKHSDACLKLLLRAGARPDSQALHIAGWLGHMNNMRLLLEAGGNPNDGLHGAAQGGRIDIVKYLLAKGAQAGVRSKTGDAPLHRAALQGGPKMVALLLQAGADPNAQDNDGDTPLHQACNGDSLEVLEQLLDAGADPNLLNRQGVTPLRYAAMRQGGYEILLKAAGGVERRPRPPEPEAMKKRTIQELFRDLADDDKREAAELALLAREKGVVEAVIESIEAAQDISRPPELLVKLGPDAVPILPRLAKKCCVKKSVLQTLWMIDQIQPGAVSRLSLPLRTQTAEAVREAALQAYDNEAIETGYYLPQLHRLGEPGRQALLKILRSKNPQHRAFGTSAVWAEMLKEETMRSEVLRLLQDPYRPAQAQAAVALAAAGDRSDAVKRILWSVLEKPCGNVENAAAYYLAEEETNLSKRLIPLLTSDELAVARNARQALKYRVKFFPREVVALLSHADKQVDYAAHNALADASPPPVEVLTKALQSPHEQTAGAAAAVLASISFKAKAALPALKKTLQNEKRSDRMRLNVIAAIVRIETPSISREVVDAVPILIRVLEAGNFGEQGTAAELLGKIGPPARQALPALRKRLAYPGKNVDTENLMRSYVPEQAAEAIKKIEAVEKANVAK